MTSITQKKRQSLKFDLCKYIFNSKNFFEKKLDKKYNCTITNEN